jgi:membrane protein
MPGIGPKKHAPFWRFPLQVARSFLGNQGLLLAGAVAYYTLLSIVPLSILALVVLSRVIEHQLLVATLARYLEMLIPGYAATLTEQVRAFLDHSTAIGFIGFVALLFFSSHAFSMLQSAMSVIFSGHPRSARRNFLLSAIIPYGYIFVMGFGIVLVSVIVGAIENLAGRNLAFLGWSMDVGGATGVALYLLGIAGEAIMFTSFYLVLPVVRVRLRYALVGGATATVLWEITRRVLIWYYGAISMVNIIYGSIAITVVALLSIEFVTLILLLGAQVIAELEVRDHALTRETPAPP